MLDSTVIDSSGTFVAAYVLVAVIFLGYALSLWMRARNVRYGGRRE